MGSTQDASKQVDVKAIEELIEKYEDLGSYERKQKKERQVQNHFIEPLLEALGWDTSSDKVNPEQRTLVGDADYSISLNGQEQFYIEAKRFSKDLDGTRRVNGEEQPFAEQAIDYAWHRRVDWAVLTNFKEIRLYWTHVPKDNPEEGLVFKLQLDEYTSPHGLERLSKLSKNEVSEGSLKNLARARERKPVTNEILNVLSDFRLRLTKDFHDNNPEEDLDDIREAVQRTLDRIVVLRVASDENVLRGNKSNLRSRLETWEENAIDKELEPLWEVLQTAFRAFHRKFGTGLFAPHLCDELELSNDVLKDLIITLDEYRFDALDSDILGSIYEDYLGHSIEERGKELELVSQEEVRRDDGIYYTPTPVVDYIVDTTVGTHLREIIEEARSHLEKEPPDFEAARNAFSQVEDVKVLDNACGSGTFLIKAYQQIVDCYDQYQDLVNDAQRQVNQKDDGTLDVTTVVSEQTISDYESKVLKQNIYGVDQDKQAIEIASMNLVLRALSTGQELPEMIGENLKTGNSLLNGSEDEVSGVCGDEIGSNAIDWESAYPDIFEDGGFTCIIGNPPWGADMDSYSDWLKKDDNYELADGQYNSYTLFLELGSNLLREDGSLGYIIPDSIFNDNYHQLRKWLLDNHQVEQLHKMGEGLFDNVYHPTAILKFTKQSPNLDETAFVSILKKEDRQEIMGDRSRALLNIIQEKGEQKRQRRFVEDDDYQFLLWATEQDYEILEEMELGIVSWNKVIDNGRGDETGKSGNIMKCPSCMCWDSYPRKIAESKGGGYRDKTCTHCDHEYAFGAAAAKRQIVSETKTDDCDRPIYFGEDVNRYRAEPSAYIDDSYSDDLKMKDEWRFESPKLLIRRSSFGFFATIDYSDARSLKANLSFRPLKNREAPYDKYDLEYFLAFLNSRTMLYYWSKVTNTVEWESHIRHTQTFIMSLPVPEIDWDDEDEVEQYNELVKRVEKAASGSDQIDEDLDWEIERKVMDLYGLDGDERQRITNELKKVQKMRIVRELYPDWVEEEDDNDSDD